MRAGFVYAGVFYLALCLSVRACAAPFCAEGGQSTMDPRLEFAEKIRTRVPVREPDGTIAPTERDIDELWRDIKPRAKKGKRS